MWTARTSTRGADSGMKFGKLHMKLTDLLSCTTCTMSPESSGLATFFAAYRLFARLLLDDRFQLRLRMEVGQLVLFDNRRILHGRAAFTASDGTRHLRGCYLARDSVQSETALLRRRLAGQ